MAPSAVSPTIIASNGSTFPATDLNSVYAQDSTGYRGYDHVTWYVGNAKQAASYYVARMGFRHVAYRGLETGSRYIASHVVSNGSVTFVLTSPIRTPEAEDGAIPREDQKLLQEIYSHLQKHGDAVKDVSFEVDDVRAVWAGAVKKGARSVLEPTRLEDENDGEVVVATIRTYGDTTHTLIDRMNYHGIFLPGYRATVKEDPLNQYLPAITLEAIDHCVGNQDWDQMSTVCE
ncbi:hypothetical protein GP486_005006 [Trichoglossum hirsutum]|uniref:4-hydroxyphenylpyruvate dioxygenase n=1 Tax=Trichoglossum hirsutum TaxID=265104 RepID=A0A9P8LAA5_9PEZI|nr:hypothetical protein GP486_005006 [Trichoglossum hirsutum]